MVIGAWTKNFLKITKHNNWILLSATPGDTWSDYIPVFIANGFYRNKTQFSREHIIYSRFSKFPKIDGYRNQGRLIKFRNQILVDMDFKRQTISHHENIWVNYDKEKYRKAMKLRWNPYKNEPIQQASELCYTLRRIVNESEDRLLKVLEIAEEKPRVIIFYNFDYELEMLKSIDYWGRPVKEWNGHKHDPLPKGDQWIYLVQYTAGAEGWNCITTDTMIFFSQNYSYKIVSQACGRIDRLTTPYKDLYYYHLKSKANIDLAINKSLLEKKSFNESRYARHYI